MKHLSAATVACLLLAMPGCIRKKTTLSTPSSTGTSANPTAVRTALVVEPLPQGDQRCTAGGVLVRSFVDENRNGVYDARVDKSPTEQAVCNGIQGNKGADGAKGESGAHGANTIVNVKALASSPAQCPMGGVEIETFLDLDDDGVFTAQADGKYSAKQVCNGLAGAPAVILASPVPVGHAMCPAGGVFFESFTDNDNDGAYDNRRDALWSGRYACSGNDSVVQTFAEGPSQTCPAGGVSLVTCTDANHDGKCTDADDTAANRSTARLVCNGVAGRDGVAGLLTSRTLPADDECKSGSIVWTSFLDNNRNGSLTAGVDTVVDERKVCRAEPGASGVSTLVTKTLTTDPRCPAGGLEISSFVDKNANGQWDDGEVRLSENTICNGIAGTAGPQGDTGATGPQGPAGANTVTLSREIPADSPLCTGGGIRFESFSDVNGNGAWDAGTDLHHSISDLCKNSEWVVKSTSLEQGEGNCAAGGVVLQTFRDKNLNGRFDENMDGDLQERTICNGTNGSNGLDGSDGVSALVVTSAFQGAPCPDSVHGTRFVSFLDNDGSGTWSNGDSQRNESHVCDGTSQQVDLEQLPVGDSHCPSGGLRIETVNGTAAVESAYVCNGARSVVVSEAISAGSEQCSSGGMNFKTFTDINLNGTYENDVDRDFREVQLCSNESPTPMKGVAGGMYHTCALANSGRISCAGGDCLQQLSGRAVPVSATTQPAQMAAGGSHSCSIDTRGAMTCWGRNWEGQLGTGSTGKSQGPAAVRTDSVLREASLGSLHSCAVTAAGGALCWGSNSQGQLGTGDFHSSATPRAVKGLSSGVIAIAAGSLHTCALTSGGQVLCWGANSGGQSGRTASTNVPVPVAQLDGSAKAVAAGLDFTCALMTSGNVSCWGDNSRGQLAAGDKNPRTKTVTVAGITDASAIVAGDSHACAIVGPNRALKCWGRGTEGQLGNGKKDKDALLPVDVSGLASKVIAVDAGSWHTCAVHPNGVYCFGSNTHGQLGLGFSGGAYAEPMLSSFTP